MKCLFLEAWSFVTKEKGERFPEIEMSNCLVVLVTIEKGDCKKQLRRLIIQIARLGWDIGNIVLAPFCHLSANLMNYEDAEKFFHECERRLRSVKNNFQIAVSKFGADKSLSLNIKSGKDSIKFREF